MKISRIKKIYIYFIGFLMIIKTKSRCEHIVHSLLIINFNESDGKNIDTYNCTTVTYANNTAILMAHNNHIETSLRLEESLFYIQIWLKKRRIRVNEAKSVQMTFTTRETCPSVILNGLKIPQTKDVKYLELHLDHRLNWPKYITIKRKQLELQLSKCTGCSAANRNYRSKLNCCCTRQSLNQYGLTTSHFGAQVPTQT